ncbi:TetR/AcrR family transcriptional regulator [Pseudonocardia acaciae]|uniref:TetR/AcrR family transcriptional regulator n=1 Tax=Pseudonocardia acaciae TaxID=551276 RepID=UPI00056D4642|nr:TetR/AcrR family transcriptional regulator [Pseudonocardia acaciae]
MTPIAIAKDPELRNVWLRPTRAGRDGPPLTRARIAAEAVSLLDEEGAERLTMRRLAERLGAGTTTLYWHVDTKDDVIDLAIDEMFGQSPPPASHTDDWRADLTTVLTGWRTALLRHPWAPAMLAHRPLIGPSSLTWMEFLQATLVRAGFTGPSLFAATWALYNHVLGSTASQTGLQLTDAERRAGQENLRAHRDSYPTLAEHGFMLDDDWTGAFETGLGYLLDGLEARLRKPPGSGTME